jgi:hypothetical protein
MQTTAQSGKRQKFSQVPELWFFGIKITRPVLTPVKTELQYKV